jgi:hypothetical protein
MDQQLFHSPDTEDGTLVNHRKLNTTNTTIMWTPIISPSKGIQSNAISKEDNGKSFATIKGVVQVDVPDHGDTGIIKCYCGTLNTLGTRYLNCLYAYKRKSASPVLNVLRD